MLLLELTLIVQDGAVVAAQDGIDIGIEDGVVVAAQEDTDTDIPELRAVVKHKGTLVAQQDDTGILTYQNTMAHSQYLQKILLI